MLEREEKAFHPLDFKAGNLWRVMENFYPLFKEVFFGFFCYASKNKGLSEEREIHILDYLKPPLCIGKFKSLVSLVHQNFEALLHAR